MALLLYDYILQVKEQLGTETTASEDSTVKKKKKKVVKKKKKKEEKKEVKAPEIASFLKNFVSIFYQPSSVLVWWVSVYSDFINSSMVIFTVSIDIKKYG